MRDPTVARRALLAFVVGVAVLGWPAEPAEARSSTRKRQQDQSRRQLRTIALDPGHGGVDPGAISPRGVHEKTITLATARQLASQLDATGRYRAVLTRRRDTFVPLRERVARARASQAELFLSLHVDALPDRDLRGLSVYTLSEQASDREAAMLAIRENREDFVTGLKLSRQSRDVSAILLDLAQRQTSNHSIVLARAIVDELGHTVKLLAKPHRSAGFAVLTAPDIPSVLVELGCLSNPEDERLLQRPAHQRQLAQALVRAIDDYFASLIRA